MYTTPRKVKQESRLRRTHSLTNNNNNNNQELIVMMDEPNNSAETFEGGKIYGSSEGLSSYPSSYSCPNQNFHGAFEAARTDTSRTTQQSSSLQQLTPERSTRNGPRIYCSNLWKNNTIYQTHSPKFPIVQEVTLTTTTTGKELRPSDGIQHFQHSHHNKLGEKLLTNHIPEFGLTPDERKALTLDSRTGKKFQQQLFSNSTAQTITRRNSLDLEKFIKVFNEEQILMSSSQGRNSGESGGIDSTMYSSYNNGKNNNALGFYNDSTSSSNSLSLSSSTSNADSLETVIYKTPTAQPTPIGHTREWREQMFAESSTTAIQMENHQPPRSDNNGYRDNSNQFVDHRQSAQVQQQGLSYPMSQFAGHNEHGLEYRSSAKSHHHHHHLPNSSSQQPVHSSSYQISSHQNGGPPPNNSGSGLMRTGNGGPILNGTTNNTNKNINPYSSQNQAQSSSGSGHLGTPHQQFPNNPDLHGLDKGKDSSKLFPTKTYNNIKDMISSRFGNSNNGSKGGVLSSHKQNAGASSEGQFNNNGPAEPHHSGGNLGLPLAPYPAHHHHNHGGNGGNPGYALQVTSNGHGPPYYVVPQNGSPGSYNNGVMTNGGGGGQFQGNSYKSPSMSEQRKDVNTSFRKAIQQSTHKSNLAEDSVQLRSVMESVHQNHHHQPQPLQNGIGGNSGQSYGVPESFQAGGHVERAQRALDRLLDVEPEGVAHYPGQDPSSKVQSSLFSRRIAAQIQSEDPNRQNLTHSYQPTNGIHQSHPNPQHSVLTSKNLRMKNSDSTLPVISYPSKPIPQGNNAQAHAHVHSESSKSSSDNPPPLPTSQIPATQNVQVSPLGLPPVPLVRENGDGSSVTIDSGGGRCPNSTSTEVLAMSPGGAENLSSSSECEVKGGQRVGSGQSHTTTDSGHGTLLTKSPLHSGGTGNEKLDGLMLMGHHKFNDHLTTESISSGNDSEWVDIVEPEIRQILELERLKKSGKVGPIQQQQQHSGNPLQSTTTHLQLPRRSNVTNDVNSGEKEHKEIPHLHHQPDSPIHESPKLSKKFDLANYNKKSSHEVAGPSTGQGPSTASPSKTNKSPKCPSTNLLRSNSGSGQRPNQWNPTTAAAAATRQRLQFNDKGKSATIGRKDLIGQTKAGKLTRNAMSQILYSLHDDGGDMTSTTTGLDLDSILDGRTENTSEDDDQSTTIDTTDAHAIRRQLESLESMYTEVLKVLGGRKQVGGLRYPPPPPTNSDLRGARRRPYGSMSSLPSSVSSRPFRESRKRMEDKKKVKDIKSINRRFQRLESHVVTLARSVAHLSSEMRTQHLMVQEMESVRNELVQLRNQVLKSTIQNQSAAAIAAANGGQGGVAGRGVTNGRQGVQSNDWTSFRNALPSLTNPCRVRKLTKFFGDEPPLIRIFLKKLGYEKYAFHFEQERIGIMELPYLTEERLQKMEIPMGPRLRILQEAHLCLKPGAQFTVEHQHMNGNTGNLSVYVV